jgi:hypothetical protein
MRSLHLFSRWRVMGHLEVPGVRAAKSAAFERTGRAFRLPYLREPSYAWWRHVRGLNMRAIIRGQALSGVHDRSK